MISNIRRWPAIVLTLLFLSLIFPTASSATPTIQNESAAPIKLQAGTFVPVAGEEPMLPPGLSVANYNVNQRGYYIVQFVGPVQQEWKDQVSALGGEILDYIPDFAFKVRMNPTQAEQVDALESVGWTGIFQPAYKLSPNLKLDGIHVYRVRLEQGANHGLTTAALTSSGADILRQDKDILLVAADAAQIQAVANVLDVAWIENFVINRKHNETGGGIIMHANIANANGFDGSSQIAAVADTGLGDGTATGAHPDIPAERVVNISSWTTADARRCYRVQGDGAIDVDSGHGTHVAVSVLGDGGPGGLGKGVAPAAGLVFQAVEEYLDIYALCDDGQTPDGYYLIGLPDDMHDLYQQAYDAGARVHSNSWGSSQAGVYSLDSANTDDFIWDNPDMTITFSAGNDGVDANSDGVVDSDSTGSPATAKNVITVGASENARTDNYPCDTGLSYTSQDAYQQGETCGSMGGQNTLGTAGTRWDFLTEPLNSDSTAGNSEQMAPFSSRGPTDDGRIKPDVVAPGTWILSGASGLYQEGYGDPVNPQNGAYQYDGWGMPYNENYKYMGGTSMSNPLTAGAATVVRDYYQKAHGLNASAALVKATLINTAVDLLDENNDGADDNDFPIPNVHEGWGRVNLDAATDGSRQFVDDSSGLGTGGTSSHQFNVISAGTAFKVSLVWSDFPSTESAAQNLVNDLDLIVKAPDGTTYLGNNFNGGWSQSNGSADRVNNVENVYVAGTQAGVWTVSVTGSNVPQGPQPYALVVGASFGATDNPPTVSIAAPTDGATVSGAVTVVADAGDDNGVTQVEFFVDGSSIGVDSDGSDGWTAPWDTTTAPNGGHTISATATDTVGQTGNSADISVTVTNNVVDAAPTVSISEPASEATVSGAISIVANPSDDIGVTEVEFFIDGGSIGVDSNSSDGWTAPWDTTTGTNGGHTISATATDTIGQTGSSGDITVTVDNAIVDSVHISALAGSSQAAPKNRWQAVATISVEAAAGVPVNGAQVDGAWSNGANGGGSCITEGLGQCTITTTNIKGNVSSVTFSISNVTASGYTYEPGSNVLSSVVIAKP